MKTLILSVLFLFISLITLGQFNSKYGFTYVGVKSAITTDWIFNKHVSQITESSQTMGASFGNSYGFVCGYNFDESVAIELDIIYNNFVQNYSGDTTYGGDFNYNSKTKLNVIDIPVLFRIGIAVYGEIGPVFSFIRESNFNLNAEDNSLDIKMDVNNFESFDIGGALGVGANVPIGENIVIDIGFRCTYGFKDVKGINGIGQTKEDLELLENETGNDYGSTDFKSNLFKVEASIGFKFLFLN